MKKQISRQSRILITLILCLAMIWPTWYVTYSRYIKYFGITLKATQDYPIKKVEYYLQSDPVWAADLIGNSDYKMGGAGCLIACLAATLGDLGISVNPGQLNQILSAASAYTADGDLIWYKIKEAIPEVDYRYSRVFTAKTIESDLALGLLPIVNVKFHGSGITHWVLIVGAQNGEFLIYDPAERSLTYLELLTHGKVYAYRVIEKH